MTRKEALEYINNMWMSGETHDALETLIPEFGESEDEKIRKGIIEIIKAVSGPDCDVYLDEKKQEKYLAWLEKQKEQKPKAKAKSPLSPHELYDAKIEGISQGRQDVIDHPEQFGLQKPAEWSEEDEEMLDSIIRVVCGVGIQPNGLREKQVSFLKSLRPSWKPSEEQMKYLLMLADYFESEGGTSNAKTLREFHEQLKKL